MKQHLRNIEERLRQILVEPLQKSGDGRKEPLDIWTEIQKHLRAQITLGIAGLPIFPSRHVIVVVGVHTETEKQRLEGALSSTMLRTAIADFLAEEGCRPPAGLWVSIEFVETPGLEVRFDQEDAPGSSSDRSGVLRVRSGQANIQELKISSRRINLGRCVRIRDEQGRGIRQNDVAFAEIRNGVNETVSRRHAHLDFDEKSGTYRLFRDSSSAETAVTSQGATTLDVPLSGPGLALKSGDIIRLGKAEIEFVSPS